MALITIELPNESFDVEIEGDQPNEAEQAAIESLIRQKTLETKTSKTEETVEEAPKFDTGTGISSGSLRAALSMAENNEEEELILAKFGIEEGEYLRDNRGRLALTPEGAAKVGQEITQNTLIDEEGFSRYDFADLASIAPELIGGVTGAIKGAAAGSFIPGLGTILGGAIGAGLGSGAGQGVEEIIEGLAGVSKQSAASIAGDIGTEAAIGFVGDLTFGVAGALFKTAKGMTYGLKELPPQEAKAAAESIGLKVPVKDPAGEPLKVLDELGKPVKNADGTDKMLLDAQGNPVIGRYEDAGLKPSLAAIGASGIISRKEKIIEKVIGPTQKQQENYQNMLKHINYFKGLTGDAGETSAEEVGEILAKGVQEEGAILNTVTQDAQKSVLETLDGIVNTFGKATTKDVQLNDEIFDILKKSSESFDDLNTTLFANIDDVLEDTIGDAAFINTALLKGLANKLQAKTSSAAIFDANIGAAKSTSKAGVAKALVDSINSLGEYTSFSQLYNLRSAIGDAARVTGTKNGGRFLQKAQQIIDSKLTSKNFKAELADFTQRTGKPITGDLRTRLDDAANSLDKSRAFYAKGTDLFETLGDHINVKSLNKLIMAGKDPNENFAKKLIRDGNPKPLQSALNAIKGMTQRSADDVSQDALSGVKRAERLRGRLANSWIREAMDDATGKVVGELPDDLAFSGVKFSQAIDNLGATADTLFGSQAGAVKSLAKQLRMTSNSKMTPEAVKKAIDEGAPKDLVDALREVNIAQRQLTQFENNSALKALNNESITPLIASETLAKPSAKAESVEAVMKFFKDRADRAVGKDPALLTKAQEDLAKMQNFYMNNVLKDFGGDAFIDGSSMKAFAKSFNEGGANGKFRSVFGEETGLQLEQFGRALNTLTKQAQGGDLIAANIASAPFQNIGKLANFSIVGRFLLNKPYFSRFMNDYKRQAAGQKDLSKAKLFLSMFTEAMAQFSAQAPGQLMQEVVNEGTKQLSAVADNAGLTSELQNLRSSLEKGVNQNRTNVRNQTPAGTGMNVQPASTNTGIGAIDVTDPSTALALGLSPSMQAIASRNQTA
jgi:hypothetical protein